MSARRPRTRFAAPLVITLAVAPACVIRTRSSVPPPSGGQVEDHRGDDTATPIANPPRPIDGNGAAGSSTPLVPVTDPPPPAVTQGTPTGPTPPIKQTDPVLDTVQAGPSPSSATTTWRVVLGSDRSCSAVMDVRCPPAPATCNPPRPQAVTCPEGITATSRVSIQELSPGSCYVVWPAPACPTGMACNPPRPQKTDCPR